MHRAIGVRNSDRDITDRRVDAHLVETVVVVININNAVNKPAWSGQDVAVVVSRHLAGRHVQGGRVGRADGRRRAGGELGICVYDVNRRQARVHDQAVKAAGIGGHQGRNAIRIRDRDRQTCQWRVEHVEYAVGVPIDEDNSDDFACGRIGRPVAGIVCDRSTRRHGDHGRVTAVAIIIESQNGAGWKIRVRRDDVHNGRAGRNGLQVVAVDIGGDRVGDAVLINDLDIHIGDRRVVRTEKSVAAVVIQEEVAPDNARGGRKNIARVVGDGPAYRHDHRLRIGAAHGQRRVGRELRIQFVDIDCRRSRGHHGDKMPRSISGHRVGGIARGGDHHIDIRKDIVAEINNAVGVVVQVNCSLNRARLDEYLFAEASHGFATRACARAGAFGQVVKGRSGTWDHTDSQEDAAGGSDRQSIGAHEQIDVARSIVVRAQGQPGCTLRGDGETLNAAEGAVQIVRHLHILERHVAAVMGVNAHRHSEIGAIRHQGGNLLGNFDARDLKHCRGGCRCADTLTRRACGAGGCLIGGIDQ